MDLSKNYYQILGVEKKSTLKEIKKSYYKLSFKHHPDKGGDSDKFNIINEAYNVLTDNREEYDLKSRWGANYDESLELLNFEFSNGSKIGENDKIKNWKDNETNIVIYIDDDFDGNIEYERWVFCKTCGGTGKDTSSKIVIRDEHGNILKMFEGDDGCDMCEGTGKNYKDDDCNFCGGKGKIGMSDCNTCKGERRILGKQKVKDIKFPKDKKDHKIETLGHASKIYNGLFGSLWLVKKKKDK